MNDRYLAQTGRVGSGLEILGESWALPKCMGPSRHVLLFEEDFAAQDDKRFNDDKRWGYGRGEI